MTELDDELPGEVLLILAEVGIAATYTARARTASATGTPVVVETPHSVTISPLTSLRLKQPEQETRIVPRSIGYLAGSGLAFTPLAGDAVTVNGRAWAVEEASPIYSGTLVAAWRLVLL